MVDREPTMKTGDGWGRGLATDLRTGILFCTCLPVPHAAPVDSGDVARASWAFPVAGPLVGGAGALTYPLASGLRLPSPPPPPLPPRPPLLIPPSLPAHHLPNTPISP